MVARETPYQQDYEAQVLISALITEQKSNGAQQRTMQAAKS